MGYSDKTFWMDACTSTFIRPCETVHLQSASREVESALKYLHGSFGLGAGVVVATGGLSVIKDLTLNAPIATKVVCFLSSAEMFQKPIWQTVWTQIRLLL